LEALEAQRLELLDNDDDDEEEEVFDMSVVIVLFQGNLPLLISIEERIKLEDN
jgi:hypothetical protein